jgi:acyl-CoA synthetase (AMP-forming)/AMP-acid ligase II
MVPKSFEEITLTHYERDFAGRHLLHSVLDYWSALKPGEAAIFNATRGTALTWAELNGHSRVLAAELHRMGFRKGDRLAVSMPLLTEHILLEYACFRLGVIHAPLDPRLSQADLIRSLDTIEPRGYWGFADYAPLREACPCVEHFLDFAPFAASARANAAQGVEFPEISPEEPAQIIFTTGSTGSPKAALLSHRSITAQNLCLGTGFEFAGARVLVNLPPSHVGCQSELLMTTLFFGGTAVTLEVFDPALSLDAIEKYRVSLLGQIPAMFHMMWRHSSYASRDFSTLKAAVYGGHAVARPFLDQLRGMAPRIGTGLGLTESSGFCTYTPLSEDPAEIDGSIGFAMPVYPMSIRGPMRGDGAAGGELPPGTIGHVCFRGPQNFLGYFRNPEASAASLSSDGYLYTGDLGSVDGRGLRFAGRAKFVIKPAGYQVFPGDVEAHFALLADKVASAGVVGVPHPLLAEAIVAFIEKRPGADLTEADLKRHARSLTGYMRPLKYVIVEPGQMPLNRVAKVDTLRLLEQARTLQIPEDDQ